MRRFSLLASAVLIFVSVIYVYNQSPRRDVSGRETTGRPATAEREKPKGTVLVEKLPAEAEGVRLEKGVLKIQPGYKFTNKNNKVTVMSMSTGGGSGGSRVSSGSWACVCKLGTGGCTTMVEDNQIFCAPGGQPPCGDKCVLSITFPSGKSEIIRY